MLFFAQINKPPLDKNSSSLVLHVLRWVLWTPLTVWRWFQHEIIFLFLILMLICVSGHSHHQQQTQVL